jgi:hypothetical protein
MNKINLAMRFEEFDELLSTDFAKNPEAVLPTINSLMENCFFEDSTFATFVTNHPQMRRFALRTLSHWLASLPTLTDETELKLISFLKVVLTKTHYSWIGDLITLTFEHVARAAGDYSLSDTAFQRLLSILQVFSTMNSLVPKSSVALLPGMENSGVTVDFSRRLESHHMYLNHNFCLLVNFTTELHLLVQSEEPSYLFSFRADNPDTGYGVYFLYDKLFFFYKLPSKAPSALNEFVIFEDVAMVVSNKWNHFSFSCQFDPLTMSSNLTITLNYQKFTKQFDFGNFISSAYTYRLRVLEGIPGQLSLVALLNRGLREQEFVKLQSPTAQQGILHPQSFETFNDLFPPAVKRQDMIFLWHPYCKDYEGVSAKVLGASTISQEKSDAAAQEGFSADLHVAKGWVAQDAQSRLPVTFGSNCLKLSRCPHAYNYSLVSSRFVEALSVLFLYIRNKDHLAKCFRVAKNLVENKQFAEMLLTQRRLNIYQLLLASLLHTQAGELVDASNLQTLIFGFNEQPERALEPSLSDYLLDFQFIDQILRTEDMVKTFFDTLNRAINDNFSLIHSFDMNLLFEHTVVLLEHKSRLSYHKALQALKLIAASMSIHSCAIKFEVAKVLLLLCRPAELDTPVQLLLLKLLKEQFKQKALEKDTHTLFFSSICNLIIKTDETNVLKKSMRLALVVDPGCERYLLYTLRCRFRKSECLERTKKVFAGYVLQGARLSNAELLINYVMRLTFVNLGKDKVFSSDMMTISPYGLINLLFEVSLVSEPPLLERILQSLWVSAKQSEADFVNKVTHKHYLVWLIALMYKYYKSPESKSLYDLADRLLLLYCTNCVKSFANADFFNQISEIVHFFSLETGNHDVKYHVFLSVLSELNANEQFIRNESALNEFLLCVIKYYYTNLLTERNDEMHCQIYEQVFQFLQVNVNNNPTGGFVPKILESFDGAVAPRQSLIRSVVGAPFALFSRAKTPVKAEDCTFKLLSAFLAHLLGQLLMSKESQVLTPIWPEFLNGFAYRFLNYLENNRSKLKPEKAFTLEVCLYYLYKFIIENGSKIKTYDEILKSAYFHADESLYKNSFAKKIIERLLDQRDYRTRTIERSGVDGSGQPSRVIEEYIDPDFEGVIETCALDAVGKINSLLKGLQELEGVYFSVEDVEVLSNYTGTGMARAIADWEGFRSKAFYTREARLRMLYRLFVDNVAQQCQIGGPFELPNDALAIQGQPFSTQPYDESGDDRSNLTWELNPYVTSEYKRPFVYPKLKPQFRLPDPRGGLALNEGFNMDLMMKHFRVSYYPCQWIDGFEVVPGYVNIDTKKRALTLYVDCSPSPKMDVALLKRWVLRPDTPLTRKFEFQTLKHARIYKFLRRKTACAVTQMNRQKIIINFESQGTAMAFISEIGPMISQATGKTYTPHQADYSLRNLTSLWRENQVSNFKFLMKLNFLASRSYEDYSQYPIFPLLMKEFGQKVILRDLEKPIGMAGDIRRSSTILSRFQSPGSFEDIPPFHYGSHYSSPTTVFNFLIRLPPYDQGSKLIHNGAHDLPDRIFFSIALMLRNINEETCDLRELIPEFFSTPEVLLNLNNTDFGINHEGQHVHHVLLPETCEGSAYRFVYFMEQLLEGSGVSLKLHNWIDLIFGYKQSGDQARKHNNLFHHLTYEEGTDLKTSQASPPRPALKDVLLSQRELKTPEAAGSDTLGDGLDEATKTQVYHFGQTPFYLFDQPFKPKDVNTMTETLSSMHAKLKYFIRLRSDEPADPNRLLYFQGVRRTGSSKEKELSSFLAVYDNQVEVWRINDVLSTYNVKNPFNLMLENTYKLDKINEELASLGQLNDLRDVIEAYMYNRLVWGGLAGGVVAIVNFTTGQLLSKTQLHDYPVTAMLLTPKEVLVTADSAGIIRISQLSMTNNTLTQQGIIFDHFGTQIRSLRRATNDKQLFGYKAGDTISLRSTNTPADRLFHLSKNKFTLLQGVDHFEVIFSFSYLNVVILHAYKDGTNHLLAVSLIGQILGHMHEKAGPEGPYRFFEIIRDENFKDHIACISSNGNVLIVDVPFFEVKKQYRSYQNILILKVAVINKRRCLLLMDEQRCIDIICVNAGKEEVGKGTG